MPWSIFTSKSIPDGAYGTKQLNRWDGEEEDGDVDVAVEVLEERGYQIVDVWSSEPEPERRSRDRRR
jgi:hypothetical protein